MAKKKPASQPPQSATGDVLVLRVALAGDLDIWRKIAILPDQTLDDLHEAIFDAFDRYDDHLYSFTFLKRRTPRSRPVPSAEYVHPAAYDPGESWGDDPVDEFDASETTIGSLSLQPKMTFEYLFDFGDSWEHLITVEAIDAPRTKPKSDYPAVEESHGESPPQYPIEDDDEEDDDEDDDETA
jgi:hypothetical protein